MKKFLVFLALFVVSCGIASFASSPEVEEKATLFYTLSEQIISWSKEPEVKKQELAQVFSWCSQQTKDLLIREACEIVYKKLSGEEAREQERLSMPAYSIKEYGLLEVVDGDTIKVQDYLGNMESVRMIGIDAPEDSTLRYGYKECFGKESTEHLKKLLEGNKTIQIEFDNTQGYHDKYNRLLWYVILNGENINKRMIADGYAFEYRYNLPYKYESEFMKAESHAKSASDGLRSRSTCLGLRGSETEVNEKVQEKEKERIKRNSESDSSSYSSDYTKWSSYSSSDRTYITGPRGGCYYINSNGNKTYVDHSLCGTSYSESSYTWHTGPRGGQYYYNSKGKKVYKKRK